MFSGQENGIYREDADEIIVREQKASYCVGILIIGIGICLFVMEILFHIKSIPMWIYLAILAICLFGILLCLEAKNRRLEINDGNMCYVNFAKKKRCFCLQDIGYVKAALNSSKGQDYIHLYNKAGEKLCKLECSMQNAFPFLSYLYDNGITIDTEKDTGGYLNDIVMQEQIAEEAVKSTADGAYEAAAILIKEWQDKNKKIGAEFYYGLAEYHGNRIRQDMQIQPKDSRCSIGECGQLPSDYLCVIEIYVQKENCFIRDKGGDLLVVTFPLIYRRKSGASGEMYRLYYNKNYKYEIESALETLTRYLPGHRFTQEQIQLGYELKKKL